LFSHDEISVPVFELSQSQLKRSRAGARHILSIGAVRKIAEDLSVLKIACAALGGTAIPIRVTLFDKSPSQNWLVAWHQDTALPLVEKETAGWGPWSTKEGVIYSHAPKHALERVLALSHSKYASRRCSHGFRKSRSVPKSDGVVCTIAKSGVIAMRPLVIHASSKS